MSPSPDTSARAAPSLQWVPWPPLAGALRFPTFLRTMGYYDCSRSVRTPPVDPWGHVLRDLRDLTRTRAPLAQDHSSTCNRIQKVLEDANIKLACVASDVFGASGRAMLQALMKGESDAEALAELSKGRLRNKIPELR